MMVTATLSCGDVRRVHEASSLFDFPECSEHENVTVVKVRPDNGAAAVVDPVQVVLELDQRDVSLIADALMKEAADLDRKARDLFRQPSAEFQMHARAGRLRSLANIIEDSIGE